MPTRSKIALVVLVILGVAALPGPAGATIYDLTSQWSGNFSSENNWTVRESSQPLDNQFSLTDLSPTPAAWEYSDHILPNWFKSPSDNPYCYGTSEHLDLKQGDVVTHGGYGSAVSNVIWTSPVAATASISGALWLTRNIGRTMAWELSWNGTLLDSGYVTDSSSRSSPVNLYIASLSLGVGDVIELAFLQTETYPDYVGVDLNIEANAVPLPGAVGLLGAGLALLAWGRRRLG